MGERPDIDEHDVQETAEPASAPIARSRIWAWGWAACFGGVIWSLGGEPFAASETSRIIGPLLWWLFPDMSAEQHASALFGVRKFAHVAEYGIFAILCLRAVCMSSSASLARCTGVAMALVATLAAADELRQGFSFSRTGSAWDVALDISGGLAALALLYLAQAWLDRSLMRRPSDAPSYWPLASLRRES